MPEQIVKQSKKTKQLKQQGNKKRPQQKKNTKKKHSKTLGEGRGRNR